MASRSKTARTYTSRRRSSSKTPAAASTALKEFEFDDDDVQVSALASLAAATRRGRAAMNKRSAAESPKATGAGAGAGAGAGDGAGAGAGDSGRRPGGAVRKGLLRRVPVEAPKAPRKGKAPASALKRRRSLSAKRGSAAKPESRPDGRQMSHVELAHAKKAATLLKLRLASALQAALPRFDAMTALVGSTPATHIKIEVDGVDPDAYWVLFHGVGTASHKSYGTKGAMGAYAYFVKVMMHDEDFLAEEGGAGTTRMGRIAAAWNKLSDEEKQEYKAMGQQEFERQEGKRTKVEPAAEDGSEDGDAAEAKPLRETRSVKARHLGKVLGPQSVARNSAGFLTSGGVKKVITAVDGKATLRYEGSTKRLTLRAGLTYTA